MRRERSQQIARSEARPRALLPAGGVLHVVSLPIGHPDDITLRALRVLREAHVIVSEDPAATHRLLSHHGIDAPVTSYGPRNLKDKVAILVHRLLKGARIAVVSDCGSPVIADPGQLLIASARAHHIPVLSVPGPSALTAVVSVSGFSGDSFFFQGHLPDQQSAMRRCIESLLRRHEHTVAFCTPESISLVLKTLRHLAPRRRMVLGCDLTRPGEMVIRGTARQIQRMLDERRRIEDITLMIAGRTGTGG
jgi:16S rRNA (cytidine1402-2'-O)-methyltransferase